MIGLLSFHRLKRGRLLHGVLTLSSATVLGQAITVAATPLLTRLYSPSDFGLFATFAGISSILLVASSLRYEFSIPVAATDTDARLLAFASLALNGTTAMLLLFAIMPLHTTFAKLAGVPALSRYLWLVSAFVLCAGWYRTFNYWAIRHKRYVEIGRTKVVQSLTSVAVMLSGGLFHLAALGLILAQIVGQTAGGMSLARGSQVLPAFFRRRTAVARMRVLLRRFKKFPKYDAPAALLDNAAVQLPNVLLAALFDPRVAGLYMLAARVLYLPMQVVGQAIGQVLLGASREALKNGTLNRLLVRVIMWLSAIILLPALALFAVAGPLFAWVFGASWREAGSYAGWMVLGIAVQFVYSPISMVLLATDGQRVNLRIQTAMMVLRAGALWYGYADGRPLVAIAALSIVTALGYAGAIRVIVGHVGPATSPAE